MGLTEDIHRLAQYESPEPDSTWNNERVADILPVLDKILERNGHAAIATAMYRARIPLPRILRSCAVEAFLHQHLDAGQAEMLRAWLAIARQEERT